MDVFGSAAPGCGHVDDYDDVLGEMFRLMSIYSAGK